MTNSNKLIIFGCTCFKKNNFKLIVVAAATAVVVATSAAVVAASSTSRNMSLSLKFLTGGQVMIVPQIQTVLQ